MPFALCSAWRPRAVGRLVARSRSVFVMQWCRPAAARADGEQECRGEREREVVARRIASHRRAATRVARRRRWGRGRGGQRTRRRGSAGRWRRRRVRLCARERLGRRRVGDRRCIRHAAVASVVLAVRPLGAAWRGTNVGQGGHRREQGRGQKRGEGEEAHRRRVCDRAEVVEIPDSAEPKRSMWGAQRAEGERPGRRYGGYGQGLRRGR